MSTGFRIMLVGLTIAGTVTPAAAVSPVDHNAGQIANRLAESGRQSQEAYQCFENQSARPDRPGTDPPTYTHGFNESTFRLYWSGDPDYRDNTNTAGEELSTSNSLSKYNALACAADLTFPRPPDVEAWNDREHDRYSSDSRPSHVSTESEKPITDAYIEIFSINPSTVVHRPGETIQVIRPDGTVRAIADYDSTWFTCSDDDPNISEYCNIEEPSVDKVSLLVNGTEVDSSSSTAPELQYQNLDGRPTLTVRMKISSDISRVRWYKNRDNIRVYNSTRAVTVRDSRTVEVQDLAPDDAKVSLANHRNSSGASVTVPELWRSVEFDTGDTVHSRWRFYTRSPEGWDEWESTSFRSGDNEELRPLQVHAVPRQEGPLANHDQIAVASEVEFFGSNDDYDRIQREFVVTHREGPRANRPSLSPEISMSRPDKHTQTTRFTVRDNSSHSISEYTEPTVHGIVRGSRTEGRQTRSGVVDAYPANMSANLINMTSDGTVIQVTVRSERGYPIRVGDVIVAGTSTSQTYSLSPSDGGAFNITVPERGLDRVSLTYRPETNWWNQGNPVIADIVATERTMTVQSLGHQFPTFVQLLDLVIVTLLWFLPLGILLYGVDTLTNGRLLGIRSS